MRKRFIELWNKDKGAALLFVAASLVLLMGVAAMGTDLAWFYLNSSRVQRAADAAALGGVIWLPGAPGTADSTALSIATANGYEHGVDNATVTPTQISDNELQVQVTDVVPTFFLSVLGFQDMTISQTAVAEYIPPLKLGSPDNTFGNECDPEQPGCSGQPNFWANIHGVWTQARMGDAYAPICHDGGAGGDDLGCTQNEIYRAEGYLYGIESDNTFTLQFKDLAFHNESDGNPTGDDIRTGDRGCEDWGPNPGADCGPTMYVALYEPDPSPLDLSDNTLLCDTTIPPEPQLPETDPIDPWAAPDGQGCWTQSGDGIFIVQVRHVYPGSVTDRSGLNRYSIGSTTGSLFALRDFSIYNNSDGSTTSFYLAEVPSFYAGKTFVIELYDPAEFSGGGTAYLQVVGPDSNIWDDGDCRVYERNDTLSSWNLIETHATGSDCEKSTTSSEFHDRWLKFEIDLPGDYSCGTCWWNMNYDYPGSGSVQDTTTWRAFIIGNPIHLNS